METTYTKRYLNMLRLVDLWENDKENSLLKETIADEIKYLKENS